MFIILIACSPVKVFLVDLRSLICLIRSFSQLVPYSLIGRALMALSSLLDSEATFAQQAEECGLS